jgi:DNA-binding transcriptional regulator GbsR (MarR family)
VRAGKEKFYVPFSNTLKKAQSNIYIIKLLHDNFIATIFQDTNQKDTRIYIKNKEILDTFRQMFGKKISQYINNEKNIINQVYQPIYNILPQIKDLQKNTNKYLKKSDIYNIKDSLYTLDFRLRHHFVYKL